MSFLNIKNKKYRDKIVADKEALVKKLRGQFMQEKLSKQAGESEIEQLFKPITQPLQDMRHSINQPRISLKLGKRKKSQKQREKAAPEMDRDVDSSDNNDSDPQEDVNETYAPEAKFSRMEKENEEDLNIENLFNTNVGATGQATSDESIGDTSYLNVLDNLDELAKTNLDGIFSGDKDFDTTYSFRFDPDEESIMLGNRRAHFTPETIYLDKKPFPLTKGVWELLALKKPENYTDNDLKNYESMMDYSSAIYHQYDSRGRPKSNAGYKYKTIINPIYLNLKGRTDQDRLVASRGDRGVFTEVSGVSPARPSTSSQQTAPTVAESLQPIQDFAAQLTKATTKKGTGLSDCYRNKKFKFNFYSDINNLISRLTLLTASKVAGNNNSDNEMIALINELFSENVIDQARKSRMLAKLNLNENL
jgi:hypothetical protein